MKTLLFLSSLLLLALVHQLWLLSGIGHGQCEWAGVLVWFPILERCLQSLSMPRTKWRKLPPIPNLLWVFFFNSGINIEFPCLHTSMKLFTLFLLCSLLISRTTWAKFWKLTQPCTPWVNVTWLWCVICYCASFAKTLWRFGHMHKHRYQHLLFR